MGLVISLSRVSPRSLAQTAKARKMTFRATLCATTFTPAPAPLTNSVGSPFATPAEIAEIARPLQSNLLCAPVAMRKPWLATDEAAPAVAAAATPDPKPLPKIFALVTKS